MRETDSGETTAADNDSAPSSSATTGDTSTTGGASSTGDNSTGDDSTGDDSTGSSTGAPPPSPPGCGDGVLDDDEACDDGKLNGVSGMSNCLDNCTLTTCGDGFLGLPDAEQCDNGNDNADNATCTASCTNAFCGDGLTGPGEECDNEKLNGVSGMSDCLADCTLTSCGDGFLGLPGTEECDQGEANADDAACTASCTNAFCGDGLTGPGEGCDDGPAGSDECTSDCAPATCGDGIIQAPETCDDENDIDTDACVNCVNASCGDGVVQAGVEQCDDGAANAVTPINCAYGVTEEDCAYCEAITCTTEQGTTSYCGDGILQADDGEFCDGTYTNASCVDCSAGIVCDSGFDSCDGNVTNGCEVNTDNDAANCGACGNNCGAGGTCSAGVCDTQPLAFGNFIDIDFYETPNDPTCTAALWYLDNLAGSVSEMCLSGSGITQPAGDVYNGGALAPFWQQAEGIAPAGTLFAYLHRNPSFLWSSEVGSTATSYGRRAALWNDETTVSNSTETTREFSAISATSHLQGSGESPSVFAYYNHRYASCLVGLDCGAPTSICMDALDVPNQHDFSNGYAQTECVEICPDHGCNNMGGYYLQGIRFGGDESTDRAIFVYATLGDDLCLVRGRTSSTTTGINPVPTADGGSSDDMYDGFGNAVEVVCTDFSAIAGGTPGPLDGIGATPGRSPSMPVQIYAADDDLGSIRLYETLGAATGPLGLNHQGAVATPVADIDGDIFVPRDGSDPGDGDDYIYWYNDQIIYRATRDIGDTTVETLHTVPAGEGDLMQVSFYGGFIYYGTDTGIYRRAL